MLKAGAELSEQEVIAYVKERLAKFKVPKRVVFLADLPRNTMGKVLKSTLRSTYSSKR